MPYIQVDVREGLSTDQVAELGARVVDIVHESIGSARAHINVAIRQLPRCGARRGRRNLVAELRIG